jgi:hypothetical protein
VSASLRTQAVDADVVAFSCDRCGSDQEVTPPRHQIAPEEWSRTWVLTRECGWSVATNPITRKSADLCERCTKLHRKFWIGPIDEDDE